MGRMVMRKLSDDARLRIGYVLVPAEHRDALQQQLGAGVRVIAGIGEMDALPDFALECAGHNALADVVPSLLRLGVDVIVASVGALAAPGMLEMLEQAALDGDAHLVPVPGAMPGIDALAAAALMPLYDVSYTGRKPPNGWLGTVAEDLVDLRTLAKPTVIFEGTAREGARLFPKNANVAAMVALAGVGFDRTRVKLIADPEVSRNTHSLTASGEFGELELTIAARPLEENPKTSALAAYSIVRSVRQRLQRIVV